ncbi:MAG: SGNH/GDSL hydrolase family protein [Rhizobacter sp.]|nr:SGNH/GDSL hydrolase family protein [Rhizobacter sp.]
MSTMESTKVRTSDSTKLSRRLALRQLFALAAVHGSASLLAGCGGGGDESAPPAPAPVPPPPVLPTTPALERLKSALARAPLAVSSGTPLAVTQGMANSAASAFGSGARVYPALGSTDQSLATIPQVWGRRRELWTRLGGAVIEGNVVHPMQRGHRAATMNSVGVCGLHFEFDGAAFEILFAGSDPTITLVADGHYMTPTLIRTTLQGGMAGAALSAPNTFVQFDFGARQRRQISVYTWSSQGPCAIATGPGDTLVAWDRSAEASFAAMADSYGGARGLQWRGGPFWEAAALLGIAHVDLDAIGSTGYAPNAANGDTLNPGNAFAARLPSSVDAQPDLFLTAGGINDNNSIAAAPYPSAAAARAGFSTAVNQYYTQLRAALPESVLVATGPWAPRQSTPTDPVALSKADAIKAALQAAGGLWVFLDNLQGGWVNSAGASAVASGPWQTGTGTSAARAGDGNGDLYLSADGVHPNVDGCLYLGARIATDLRAALLTL